MYELKSLSCIQLSAKMQICLCGICDLLCASLWHAYCHWCTSSLHCLMHVYIVGYIEHVDLVTFSEHAQEER